MARWGQARPTDSVHRKRYMARRARKQSQRLSGILGPLLCVRRQPVGQVNPRRPVLDPRMVGGGNGLRVVKAANSNINLVCPSRGHERQRGAALRAEITQPSRPLQLSRLPLGKTKAASTKGSPSHQRRPTAAATIRTVTMRDMEGLAGGLIAHVSAQTTAVNYIGCHDPILLRQLLSMISAGLLPRR